MVIDMDNMEQLRVMNINTGIGDSHVNKFTPILSQHMIPGFEFKFMLEFYDSQCVYLRDVETG